MCKNILTLFLFIVSIISITSVASSEPFYDTKVKPWAYDAVNMLEKKGFVVGYPDDYFKGDRTLTRYEMAMVIARVVVKLKQIETSVPENIDLSGYATKDDLKTIDKLVKEFHDELAGLGVKVNNVEDSLKQLTSRIEGLERVKISGNFSNVAVSIGYAPGDLNTVSYGNPIDNQGKSGPSAVFDSDRYSAIGLARLYQGFAIISKLDLTITTKISDKVKAGGDFSVYSGFGEKGNTEVWGPLPSYNPLGVRPGGLNFRADLATLWFDTTGNWKFKGKYGDYKISKVSSNLFAGPNAGKAILPINGVDLCGTLYDKINVETFMARNINSFINFNDPDLANTNSLYSYGNMDSLHFQSNRTWYPLAVPYNDGYGSRHAFSYDKITRGQYDNYMYGFWVGHDFSDNKGHIDGTYLRIFEDYSSNPNFTLASAVPKSTTYFGFSGYYKLYDDKIKIFGEFNQSRFNYNLLNPNSANRSGNLYNFGGSVTFDAFKIEGKFIWVDANYDPFSYHKNWHDVYFDGHHNTWMSWKYGLTSATRLGEYMANRAGVNISGDYYFGEKKKGHLYADFFYQKQVNPTAITNDEHSFQKFDFLGGALVDNVIGANVYGNQDQSFIVNDTGKGSICKIEAGGKYSFCEKWHVWGIYERYKIKRDFEQIHLNPQNQPYNYEQTLHYFYGGVTYDVTDKFSVQGHFAYADGKGVTEAKGAAVDWSQVIPGAGFRYAFNESTDFILDYKFYKYTDNTVNGTNDYHCNKIMTRLSVKF